MFTTLGGVFNDATQNLWGGLGRPLPNRLAEAVRRTLLIAGLAAVLGACNIFPSGDVPEVVSVDPRDGEQNVGINRNVRASLRLPAAAGQINLTTLSKESVSLTSDAGTAVAATRSMSDDGATLLLDPVENLEPQTRYTFNVTSDVQTENGTALRPFTSSFTTGTDVGVEPDPERNLTTLRPQVLFTAGGATSSDTRTLTLINAGGETVTVSSLTISGPDEAQFSLAEGGGFSLGAGEQRDLELTFSPDGVGPQLATLTVTSDDPLSSTLEVPLGGLGVRGQGGSQEPSLQWIFDTYRFGVDSGDDDPSTFSLVESPTNSLLGDEVSAQRFVKANSALPVTAEVIATFGVENDPVVEFGYYPAGTPASRQKLFDIQQTPTLNAQRLAPEVDAVTPVGPDGLITFDPGEQAFGTYSYWPTNRFFEERSVYSEHRLNTFPDAIPHQVRAYPLKDESGAVVENAYVLATEEFTQGFDYNDVVVVLRNVTPETGGAEVDELQVSNALGLPFSDRLVLQQIQNTSGNLCEPEINPGCDPDAQPWAEIAFRNTGVVELTNLSDSPLQLSLSVADSNLFVLPNGETTLSLPGGGSYDLTVQFAPVGLSDKGVFESTLNVQVGSATTRLELAGIFMRAPEGGREVYLAGIVNDALGYTTDLGANSQGGLSSAEPNSPLAGEEVRSAYWEAAVANRPVVATQIAAFHSCCTQGDTFELWARGASSPFAGMRHEAVDSQSIYPRLQGQDELARISANAGRPFEVRVAGYSSDPSIGRGNGNLGVRFWPVRDRSGQLVPNTYIVAQDFVENGCGTSEVANCDFNDNMYVVSNITPAD